MLFSIQTEFDLSRKPAWLDDFRLKYDDPYRYHVTLKNLTIFDGRNLDSLKTDLLALAADFKPIEVSFSELSVNTTSKGGCIMILAEENSKLKDIQKIISNTFSKYGISASREVEKFDSYFMPHITIGRHLTPENFEIAKKELSTKDLSCSAIIDECVLTIVKEDTVKEKTDPKNKFFFKFMS